MVQPLYVKRYIRLTNLCPELLDMVDEKRIGFNPAVELSFLNPTQQKDLLEAIEYSQSIPSLSQAQRIKALAIENRITQEGMNIILSEEKKQDVDRVTLKNDVLKKYFPKSYTPRQMEDTIIKLLEQWQKKQQRNKDMCLQEVTMIPVEVDLSFDENQKKADRLSKYQELIKQNKEKEEADAKN